MPRKAVPSWSSRTASSISVPSSRREGEVTGDVGTPTWAVVVRAMGGRAGDEVVGARRLEAGILVVVSAGVPLHPDLRMSGRKRSFEKKTRLDLRIYCLALLVSIVPDFLGSSRNPDTENQPQVSHKEVYLVQVLGCLEYQGRAAFGALRNKHRNWLWKFLS